MVGKHTDQTVSSSYTWQVEQGAEYSFLLYELKKTYNHFASEYYYHQKAVLSGLEVWVKQCLP
jgi:hypothetical protein